MSIWVSVRVFDNEPRLFEVDEPISMNLAISRHYFSPLFTGLTIITISPSSARKLQSNLSLFFRLNYLAILAGTVVLSEVVLVAAFVKVVISPNSLTF